MLQLADQAAQHKRTKYANLASAHMFCLVAIETSGARNAMAVDLVQKIGRRVTVIIQLQPHGPDHP